MDIIYWHFFSIFLELIFIRCSKQILKCHLSRIKRGWLLQNRNGSDSRVQGVRWVSFTQEALGGHLGVISEGNNGGYRGGQEGGCNCIHRAGHEIMELLYNKYLTIKTPTSWRHCRIHFVLRRTKPWFKDQLTIHDKLMHT